MDTREEKREQEDQKPADFLQGQVTREWLKRVGTRELLRFVEVVAVATPLAAGITRALGTPTGAKCE